ncbi:MAG: S1C family serine protease [Patescibacteria group bacterium]
MKFIKKSKDQSISQIVILSMVFGLVSGVVGQIIADVYIDPWKDNYVNETLTPKQRITATIPELQKIQKSLGLQQDFEVNDSVTKMAPSVIGVYFKKASGSSILNQIYLPAELQANGFILTSDGWLLSYGKILSTTKKDQLVVVYDQKAFAVENKVVDTTTGVVFLKINANNLPVVAIGDSSEITLGQVVIALNDLREVGVTNVKNVNWQPALGASNMVMSSETYSQLISLNTSLADAYLGSPLVNLSGEVIGIIREADSKSRLATVIPVNQFHRAVLNVLKGNEIVRPFLGINYIDLALAVGLDQSLTKGLTRGALVYQKPKEKSPASLADIQANDIILSVDGQTVNKNSSLTDLILQYQPNDKISLEISREGKIFTKAVTLAALAE